MGRHLSLACDNCVPGDASGWYLPLAALVMLSVAGGALAWLLANDRIKRSALLLRVAGLALLAGPPVAVFLAIGDVTYDRAACGTALSASLERGLPDDSALDHWQAGCKAKGERVVGAATAYGGATLGVAVLAGTVAFAAPARSALPA